MNLIVQIPCYNEEKLSGTLWREFLERSREPRSPGLENHRPCRAYSVACFSGEMGDIDFSTVEKILTEEEFEKARKRGCSEPQIVKRFSWPSRLRVRRPREISPARRHREPIATPNSEEVMVNKSLSGRHARKLIRRRGHHRSEVDMGNARDRLYKCTK